jgi:DNA polymerase zeta
MRPPSEKVTPNSMLRNMFAKNKPSYSPHASPSKPPTYHGINGNSAPNTIVLTPSKRSAQGWQSPSPEPDDKSDGTPTPTKPPMKHTFDEVKQELKEIQASDEPITVQAGQIVKSSKSSGDPDSIEKTDLHRGVKHELSPTLKNDDEGNPFLSLSGSNGDSDTPRAKKRVRMASPDPQFEPSQLISSQPLLPTPPRQTLSQLSIPSNPTEDSTSTVPSHLSSTAWTYRSIPPSRGQITTTMEGFGVDTEIYTDPHYSNRADIPPRAKMFAGRMFTLRGRGLPELEEFESSFSTTSKGKGRTVRKRLTPGRIGWEYAPLPPGKHAVLSWCEEEDAKEAEKGNLRDSSKDNMLIDQLNDTLWQHLSCRVRRKRTNTVSSSRRKSSRKRQNENIKTCQFSLSRCFVSVWTLLSLRLQA